MTDDTDSQLAQLMIFAISQCLRRSDNDRLTSVNTQRVEVLHVTNSDTVIKAVAHYLVLYLFPSLQALFYQYLRRERESLFCQYVQLFFIIAEARTETSQRIRSTDDNRITQFLSRSTRIFYIFYRLALDGLYVNLIELLNEQLAVFCIHNSLHRSSQYTSVIFLEHTCLIQSHTAVKRSLSAKRQQHTVGAFFSDYLFYKIRSYRKEINLICHTF